MRNLFVVIILLCAGCAGNKAVVKKAISQNIFWDKRFSKIELPLITNSLEYGSINSYLIDSGFISPALENKKVNNIVVQCYEITEKAKPFLDTAFFVPEKKGEYVAVFNFFKIRKWSINRFSFSNNKDTLKTSLNVIYDYTDIFPKKEPEKNIACVFVKTGEKWKLLNTVSVLAEIYVDPGPDHYYLLKKRFTAKYEHWFRYDRKKAPN